MRLPETGLYCDGFFCVLCACFFLYLPVFLALLRILLRIFLRTLLLVSSFWRLSVLYFFASSRIFFPAI